MAGDHPTVTVLLTAESSELTRTLLSRLEAEGCIVKRTDTGAEALAAAATGFDLILLDLQLPDVEGLEVLRQLRGRPATASTPVFLLKGEGEPAHVLQRGLDFGATGYVSKHRLPSNHGSISMVDHLILASSVPDVYESGNSGPVDARRDTCPYSSRHEFGRCQAFLPLGASPAEKGSGAVVSCSHLRVGAAESWRLYPRCAIGDQAARDRYQEERTPL